MEKDGQKNVAPIGLVVNPRSGTDVRRAIAAAGSVTVADKANIVRRVVLGAVETGAHVLLFTVTRTALCAGLPKPLKVLTWIGWVRS